MASPHSFLSFVKKERSYILFVFFIAFSFFMIKFHMQNHVTTQSIALDEVKHMDVIMEENIKNPEYIQEQLEKDPVFALILNSLLMMAVAALAAGVALNVLMIFKMREGKPWLETVHGSIGGDWGVSSIIRVVILFLFYTICSNFVLIIIKDFLPQSLQTNFLIILHTTLTDALVLIFVFHFVKKFTGAALKPVGIKRLSDAFGEIWIGIKSYLATLPSFLTVLFILIAFSAIFSYEPPPHPLIHIFLEEEKRAPWLVAYALLVACVFGPIVEEVFFRGFVYGAIRRKWGVGWATVITSLFFAYVHDNWFAFVPIFFLSCVLCYLYEKRKTLIPSMTLHVIHNTAFIFYFFLLKRLLIPEDS